MTAVERLRERQRDMELTAVARSDAGDIESARVAAIIAVVLGELADAVEHEHKEAA